MLLRLRGRAGGRVRSRLLQERPDGGELRFGPEPRQDYELEVGLWLGGAGNPLGTPMSLAQARDASGLPVLPAGFG